jgi:hypothetical protein
MNRSGESHVTLRGQPREICLTLDLVVATQMLMQLAVRDIGQVTDISRPCGHLRASGSLVREPLVPTRPYMAVSGTADA